MPFRRKSFCHTLTPLTEKNALTEEPESPLGWPTGAVVTPAESCASEAQLRDSRGRLFTA